MFQDFEDPTVAGTSAPRLEALRRQLGREGLDGFLVPRTDEHQGEYVAPGSERLRWLTGFSGSAGVALVLSERAVLFVDGRYTLQARRQADPTLFEVASLTDMPPSAWLAEQARPGQKFGFDPWLHTLAEAAALRAKAGSARAEMVPLAANPIDALWTDRPAPPRGKVEIQPIEFAGELARDKLPRLAEMIAQQGATHAVLTDPASLAWAFNIRGADIAHTPVPLGFAILAADGTHQLFLDPAKLSRSVKAYLTQLCGLRRPADLEDELARLASTGGRIALDPHLAAERLRMLVSENGGTVIEAPDPARLPRATKNDVEIAGSRAAHRRDGAAIAALLAWLDAQKPGSVDEIGVATALEGFRRKAGEETQMPLRDISFDTISGAGENGAIVHYRVTRATNRKLAKGELFLLDSGGQYQDGTTDITRTVAIGEPSAEMRTRFTQVLKGMIALSMLRFPPGTRGQDIDALARQFLWQAGCDYAHGTGHGIGAFLSVHEGPQRISKTGGERLLPGMIVSNEPGYYKEGAYGIRCENLILVRPAEPVPDGDIAMHSFETLTLAPFDRRLIDKDLLSPAELDWLNAYHARVLAEIGSMVDAGTREWLEKATGEI